LSIEKGDFKKAELIDKLVEEPCLSNVEIVIGPFPRAVN
jgi:hypothetical protein